jgi:SagB-type dehydrogenase family enzyme
MAFEAIDDLFIEADYDLAWELFHENSKMSFVEPHPIHKVWPSDASIVASMNLLRRVKPFEDFPKIALPDEFPSSGASFSEVVWGRQTARGFGPGSIRLDQLARLLMISYGVNRDNEGTTFPRPFRVIPSGGALYPLELYIYAARVDDLEVGLYHYDPEDHTLDVLRLQDDSEQFAKFMVQVELAQSAAAVIYISSVFARSTFKYGDRGYRFILLEAGHLGQNANLAAREMGLASANIGGYADRSVDRYLGFDGLTESTIYMFLLGTHDPHGDVWTEPGRNGDEAP